MGWRNYNEEALLKVIKDINDNTSEDRDFNFFSKISLKEIANKLSTIIRQNNEAFNQREKENGDN